jgi:hypothetical protein
MQLESSLKQPEQYQINMTDQPQAARIKLKKGRTAQNKYD